MTGGALQPCFLITIDTEEDRCWSRPRAVTTENARFLPRFQQLCDKYGLRPTWLTTDAMTRCPVFRDFANDVLARKRGEIGMHLHAWNSPPDYTLTNNDYEHQPFLTQYPEAVMREKVESLTDLLEQTFQQKMRSHRAGRWGFDRRYAAMLAESGYEVDCSVTPFVTWHQTVGAPNFSGGPDFRAIPESPYFLDLEDISRPGSSPLLEVPMTIRPQSAITVANKVSRHLRAIPLKPIRRAINYLVPESRWLRPDGRNLNSMMSLVDDVIAEGSSYLEFMLHSSELMPGGSPRFPTATSIERLYAHLEELFAYVSRRCRATTLQSFRETWVSASRSPATQVLQA